MDIPESFILSPFYNKGDQLDRLEDPFKQEVPPFYFDILYEKDPKLYPQWPWESREGSDLLLQKWEQDHSLPEMAFRKRKPKEAKPYMIQLTAQFICFLFWSEGRPVRLDQGLQTLNVCKIGPVNLEERLSFICHSPDHYHSFVQLSALFDEARKKRAVYRLKQKG